MRNIPSDPIPNPTLALMRGGFQMQDLRGYTLSIGIGNSHYCDNRNPDMYAETGAARTMEVAVIETDGGGFVPIGVCDDVAGYVPVTELSGLIEAVWEHDWDRVRSICNTEDN